ncbi:MAG TPA: hypothetical protein VLZ05_10975 [Mycobacterium sp.]|nr:hypothetical protein [Mycobacterium sp.]HUH69347.1 hypothetical protein [Mycobacterium sp.]
MADAKEPPEDSPVSQADAIALAEEAEAQVAEAEALAAAARARARAARLRHEAISLAEAADNYGDAAAAAADAEAAAHDIAEDTATEEASPEDEEAAEEYDEEYDGYYDEESDETAAPESVTEPATWRRWMPSLSTIVKVAAIVLIICFAGGSACMVLQHRDTTQHRQREAAFVAGAKQGVINMTSLDFNKAKEDVQRVIDSSTGQFKDDFQQRAKDFIFVVEQSKAVTEGTVNAAAVESMNGNSAVVLVSATSRVTNSPGGKNEPPKIWRLRVTVAEVGGQYKMSKVEYVP